MATDNGFQHYFTTFRRTLPRRVVIAPSYLWKRPKSTRSSIKSALEPVSTRVSTDMESQTSLTNGNHHDSPPATDGPPPPAVSNFDPDIFRTYLSSLLPPVIGAKPSDLHSLFDDEFEERVSRFAADTGGVIYVVQVKEESEGVPTSLLSFYNMPMRMFRRLESDICLPPDPASHVPSITRNHSRTNQTRAHTGSFDTSGHSTSFSESFRRRRDTVREFARCG
jgi:hypothetical protein